MEESAKPFVSSLLDLPIEVIQHHIVIYFRNRSYQINFRSTCKVLKQLVDKTIWKQWVDKEKKVVV